MGIEQAVVQTVIIKATLAVLISLLIYSAILAVIRNWIPLPPIWWIHAPGCLLISLFVFPVVF